jgi:hypothetical protein
MSFTVTDHSQCAGRFGVRENGFSRTFPAFYEHVFVSCGNIARPMAPPPYPMFREALAGGNLRHALRLARELPTVALGDAAKLLALMANDEHGSPELFERAAVRWLNRFTSEVKGVTLQHAATAVRALDELDEDAAALSTLLRLCP